MSRPPAFALAHPPSCPYHPRLACPPPIPFPLKTLADDGSPEPLSFDHLKELTKDEVYRMLTFESKSHEHTRQLLGIKNAELALKHDEIERLRNLVQEYVQHFDRLFRRREAADIDQWGFTDPEKFQEKTNKPTDHKTEEQEMFKSDMEGFDTEKLPTEEDKRPSLAPELAQDFGVSGSPLASGHVTDDE